jgi:simple sugar transport system ATP-binding protein
VDAPVVLELRGLTKRFGPVLAVDAVDLTLRRGEVLALLGENGAGKTTLMNMLFGHYLPDSGTVRVADANGALRVLPLGEPQAALAAGVGMVHQHFTLAENLTALDNILLGAEPLFALRRNRRAARDKVERLMAESGLIAPLDLRVQRLSVGERQRVEILKALYRDARVLVLDEPTAVLTPQEADALFGNVGRMAANGLSVIFISHKMREVMAFSHRIAVLRGGGKVGEMTTAKADAAKIAALMVGHATAQPKRRPGNAGPPVVELIGVDVAPPRGGRALTGATLALHAGEVVGLAGVSGNGQGALAALLSGLSTPTRGEIRIGGEALARVSPATLMAQGVGRIPEDRHHDGVVGDMTVAENLVIERLDDPEVSRGGFLRLAAIRAGAERLTADYDVRGPGVDHAAKLLSGGNIQKLILARVLDREPRIILANQPTRGLDIGAAAEVGRRLIAARDRGAAVLLISEDLDEILAWSDRVLAIHDGAIMEAGATDGLDRARLGLLMAGKAA